MRVKKKQKKLKIESKSNSQTQIKKPIASLFAKSFLSTKAIYEFDKIKKTEQKIKRNYLIHKTGNKKRDKTYDFQKFKKIRSFGRKISSGIVTLVNAREEKVNSQYVIDEFKESAKPKVPDNAVRLF